MISQIVLVGFSAGPTNPSREHKVPEHDRSGEEVHYSEQSRQVKDFLHYVHAITLHDDAEENHWVYHGEEGCEADPEVGINFSVDSQALLSSDVNDLLDWLICSVIHLLLSNAGGVCRDVVAESEFVSSVSLANAGGVIRDEVAEG